jgi:signal transduction histidine kinase
MTPNGDHFARAGARPPRPARATGSFSIERAIDDDHAEPRREALRDVPWIARCAPAAIDVVTAIPEPAWLTDRFGVPQFVNQRALEHAHGGVVHRSHGWPGVHPDDAAQVSLAWAGSLASGAPFDVELRARCAGGVHRWQRARAVALRRGAEPPYGWLATCTDIHDRKVVEDELAARNELERTLIGVVSHDLRGPLHSILLGLDALPLIEPLGERAVHVVARMRAAAQRSGRMIHDLLDFTEARIGGGISIVPVKSDLSAVVRQAVDEARATHPSRAFEVHGAEAAIGLWDVDRIAQALGNLLGNAVQHGRPDRPITVTIRARDHELWLEVHNVGAPIPDAARRALFMPMTRGAGALDRRTRSIGLGLFIVRAIATGHGGTVEVESSEERGTIFRMKLPASLVGTAAT